MRVLNITQQEFGTGIDEDRAHNRSYNQRGTTSTQRSACQEQGLSC
jgi:hypothetical protein